MESRGQQEPIFDRPLLQKSSTSHLWEREILDRLVENLPGAPTFLTDAYGVITSVNEAFGRVLGYSADDVVGRSAAELFVEGTPALRRIVDTISKMGRVDGHGLLIATKDGMLMPCVLTAHLLQSREGRVAGFVGMLTEAGKDCLAQRYPVPADRSVQGSGGSLSAVVEFDEHTRICGWDQGAQAIFGYTERQALGRGIAFIVPAQNIQQLILEKIRDNLSRGGMFKSVGIPAVDAKGSRLYFNATWLPKRNKTGMPVGKAAIITKVPDPVEVLDSTSNARRLEAMTKMAARAAHELKNPLASIRLNVEAVESELRRDAGGQNREELLDQMSSVMKELDRLEQLTQAYLQWVHVPRAKLTPCSLPPMLQGLQEFLGKEMQSRRIRFENDFPAHVPSSLFDEGRMREAILNLYMNAADAMPDGGEIRTRVCVGDEWVDIHVSDTGSGICEDDAEKIFEPFYTSKECGTGLGLPIARDILVAHGGTLTVHPSTAGGAHFVLRLPLAP
jgi:PAS domain S-box-containing protein